MPPTTINNIVVSHHGTLTAGDGNHDIVNFKSGSRRFEIVNFGPTDIYVRSDGTAPTIGADETEVIRAGESILYRVIDGGASGQIILVSSGAAVYHLRRED